ncbi:MAG: hypothetical protein ACQEQD_04255 [Bacillota bacterium]
MKNIFDEYLGEYFNKSKVELLNKGYELEDEEVKPYEDMEPSGQKRVIDIRMMNNNKLKIIWSYEDYN